MSEKITWLITGYAHNRLSVLGIPFTNNLRQHRCSRGIGLELTRQLLTDSSTTVVATCRNPESATDLHALKTSAQGTLHIARIDVADEASIRSSVAVVEELLGENAAIDYIYNNAAIVCLALLASSSMGTDSSPYRTRRTTPPSTLTAHASCDACRPMLSGPQ